MVAVSQGPRGVLAPTALLTAERLKVPLVGVPLNMDPTGSHGSRLCSRVPERELYGTCCIQTGRLACSLEVVQQ